MRRLVQQALKLPRVKNDAEPTSPSRAQVRSLALALRTKRSAKTPSVEKCLELLQGRSRLGDEVQGGVQDDWVWVGIA